MPEKKSPWMKEKDQVHPADLPEEVYQEILESDDAKLDRDLIAARLLDTKVPPENEWKQCFACGAKVPLRFRDPVYGIPVCRKCNWTSALHGFIDSLSKVVGGASQFFGVDDVIDDDEEIPEGELPEDELPEDELPEDDDAPTVPQDTSPSAVEADGGGAAKTEPEPEAATEAEKPEDTEQEQPPKEE